MTYLAFFISYASVCTKILSLTVQGGYIFLHDTFPPSERYLDDGSCSDSWKLRKELEKRKDLEVFTFTYGCGNVGLTMVRRKPKFIVEERTDGKI